MAIDKSKMKCNKPQRTPDGPKKFVVKACKDGKEKIIRFGDPICASRSLTQNVVNHLGQGISVPLPKTSSLQDIGPARNGNQWLRIH
jgi:hypothetical protein